MDWLRFWKHNRRGRELLSDLQEHIERETDDSVARGMTPLDARRAASAKLGNVVQIRESLYDRYTVPVIESVWRDLRYAGRQLRGAARRLYVHRAVAASLERHSDLRGERLEREWLGQQLRHRDVPDGRWHCAHSRS